MKIFREIGTNPSRQSPYQLMKTERLGSMLLLVVSICFAQSAAASYHEIRQAAERIVLDAKEVEKATDDIVEATKAIKDNLQHVTDQRVIDDNLDPALAKVKQAVKENQTGLDELKEAEKLLEEARSLENLGKKSEANQKAEDAKKQSKEAAKKAEAASNKARDAKDQANRAKQTSDNAAANPNAQPVAAGEEKRIEDGANKEEGKANDQGGKARGVQQKHDKIEDEEDGRAQSQHGKEEIRLDGEIPLRPLFRLDSIFDVFYDLFETSYPNADSSSALPTVGGFQEDIAELRLLLVNENPFPVVVTDVEGLLFGDAISFISGPLADQVLLPMDSLSVLLGTVEFIGPPNSFTAADFSVITASDHPGLGPDFAADFQVVSEPNSTLLIGLGIVIFTFAAQRRLLIYRRESYL